MDFRKKLAKDNLNLCYKSIDQLSEWEFEFIKQIKPLIEKEIPLSEKQFNKLHEITIRFK